MLMSEVVDDLRSEMAELREECIALRECLISDGLLRPEVFLAQLHRRTAMSCSASTPSAAPSLILPSPDLMLIPPTPQTVASCSVFDAMFLLHDAISSSRVAHTVGIFASSQAAQRLRASSRLFASLIKKVGESRIHDACSRRWVSSTISRASEGTQSVSSVACAKLGRQVEVRKMTVTTLCVCGGRDGDECLNTVECHHPLQQAWVPMPPMERTRQGAAVAVMDGTVFICGGYNGEDSLSSIERFNLSTNTWESLPPMLQRRYGAVAAAVSGKIVVCGGDDGREPLSTVEVFDPRDGAWKILPPMMRERFGASSVVVAGEICVCGGYSGLYVQDCLNSVEAFDPVMELWQLWPSMGQRRYRAAAVAVNSSVYVCGGRNLHNALSTTEVFDCSLRVWSYLMPMPCPVYGAAIAVANDKIFLCGGHDGQECLRTSMCFDPDVMVWETLSELTESRVDAVAAPISLTIEIACDVDGEADSEWDSTMMEI